MNVRISAKNIPCVNWDRVWNERLNWIPPEDDAKMVMIRNGGRDDWRDEFVNHPSVIARSGVFINTYCSEARAEGVKNALAGGGDGWVQVSANTSIPASMLNPGADKKDQGFGFVANQQPDNWWDQFKSDIKEVVTGNLPTPKVSYEGVSVDEQERLGAQGKTAQQQLEENIARYKKNVAEWAKKNPNNDYEDPDIAGNNLFTHTGFNKAPPLGPDVDDWWKKLQALLKNGAVIAIVVGGVIVLSTVKGAIR